MKIKSIAAICKKGKQVVLYNRYESGGTLQQYIGDGMTAYPVSGLPKLDEESILTIFDVPEKQREDWFVRVRDVPEGINFEDTDANEKMIERDNLSIIFSGHTLKPLQTRRGWYSFKAAICRPCRTCWTCWSYTNASRRTGHRTLWQRRASCFKR